MTRWIYVLADACGYPEPLGEISALAYHYERAASDQTYLLLADRESPPMCAADSGDEVLLCTRNEGRLACHGIARVAGRPQKSATPQDVEPLYGVLAKRVFAPLTEVRLVPARAIEILTEDEQRRFAKGQAYVRRVGPRVRARALREPPPAEAAPVLGVLERRRLNPQARLNQQVAVLGLDPTAGTWLSRMTEGPKPMPSVRLEVQPDGRISVADGLLELHRTNDEWLARVTATNPAVHCIDGPCGTNGPRVLPDWSAWDANAPDGVRDAERALAADGIALYWTTHATVTRFEGASRWIARSLRLFDALRRGDAQNGIETHPHGGFTYLWRAVRAHGSLAKKRSAAGRAQRIALLSAFIEGIDERLLPDHDAVDAACAALVAALHVLGRTRCFGSDARGGPIWMPSV